MANFSDLFTHGGRTQLFHKWHRTTELFVSTLKIGLGIFILTYGALIWSKHNWQEFWFLLCSFKAWIRVDYLNILPRGWFDESYIMHINGTSYAVDDLVLCYNLSYNQFKHLILSNLFKNFVFSLLIAVVSCVGATWFLFKVGYQKRPKIVLDLECVPEALQKKILESGSSTYRIADMPMPNNAEFKHIMLTGTTGVGKSNMLHQLLEQIRSNGDQAIIVDTTGGLLSRFYDANTHILMNPLDERSRLWNMWEEGTHDHVWDEIAESMMPDTPSIHSNLTQEARHLLSSSMRVLKEGRQESYKNLLDMMIKLDVKVLRSLLKDTRVNALLDPSMGKTFLRVRALLANHLRVFDCLADTKEGVSLINFMKNNTKDWMYLSCPIDQRSFLKPIFTVWLSLIIKGLMTRAANNGSRTWILIDELSSLNKIPSLMKGLAASQKHGGCFVIGFKDLNQVEEIYGNAIGQTLSPLMGTKVIFRANELDIASRVARFLGEPDKEKLAARTSNGSHARREGVNLNKKRKVKSKFSASDIMMLNDLEAYVQYPGTFPVVKIKFEYKNYEILSEAYQPKPATTATHEDSKINATLIKECVTDNQNSSKEKKEAIQVIRADIIADQLKDAAKDKDDLTFNL